MTESVCLSNMVLHYVYGLLMTGVVLVNLFSLYSHGKHGEWVEEQPQVARPQGILPKRQGS